MIDVSKLSNLITSEYSNCDKFKAFLEVLLNMIKNNSILNHRMSVMMNLETATGEVLDMIGSIVGFPRRLNFQPINGSAILDDDRYRFLLKARIIKNTWDGTISGFYDYWETFFPNNPVSIIDRQNMTAQIVVFGVFDSFYKELIQNNYIIPKPAGVRYEYAFVEDVTFAFDRNTDLLKGWDLGQWYNWEE